MPNTRNKHRPYHHPHPRPDNNPNRPNKSHTLYTKNGPRQSMNTLFQNSPPNIQFPK